MITAQAIVERGMLESLVSTVMGIPGAIEAQIGPGNAKWAMAAAGLVVVFWAFRRRS